MLASTSTETISGLATETMFVPPYCPQDFRDMAALLDDATMRGVVAVRFIHDQEVRIIVTNGSTA